MYLKRKLKGLIKIYNDSGFLKKIFLMYLVCGIFPLLLILIYYYYSTTNILLEQAYENMEQSMNTTENSLNQTLQPYQTMMEMLKNDKSLYIQLNMNYANTSYADLAYYVDDTLESMMGMYPELEGIHFYSNNATLPDDQYYFFLTGDIDRSVVWNLDHSTENIIIAGASDGSDDIIMVSRLNYYYASVTRNYLEFQIKGDSIRSQLNLENENSYIYLLDRNGQIITSDNRAENFESVQEFLPSWDTLAENIVSTLRASDGQKYICMKSSMGNGMTLLMLVDKSSVLRNVRSFPIRTMALFGCVLCLLLLIGIRQGQIMKRRLEKILGQMHEIGEGNFQSQIEPMGNDEFGQIAAGVNQMSSQIELLIQDNYEKQLTIKNSELNLLQEQINPHFLYNALAVISSLAMRGNSRDTIQSIRYLADFYRISLNKGRKIITVGEEIALLQSYMKIQLLRFSDLVEIIYEVAPEVEKYYTIKLLLQPLVENAIHHAREEEMFLTIIVRVYEKEERVCFEVEDNGLGMPPSQVQKLQQELLRQEEGFGLKNVDKRIKLTYGQDYGASIFSWQCADHAQKNEQTAMAESSEVKPEKESEMPLEQELGKMAGHDSREMSAHGTRIHLEIPKFTVRE